MSPVAITPEHFATFGELLKYLRRQARLTQAELALAVGYSDAQISRMEKDERIPDPATIMALLVPALEIEQRPQWVARLVDLAEAAHAAEAVQDAVKIRPTERSAPLHNIPIQLTSFIGREKEIAEVLALFKTRRLVTIIGPGGMGKTRLSFQVANELLPSFPQGIWLVELASLGDPALVPFSLANTMGLREAGEPNLPIANMILDHLRSKKALLLFDNCEHLVEAVAHLIDLLLRECPEVSILATSREALHLPGEAVFRLPPMIAPDLNSDADTLMRSESVRLFVERANDALPGFMAAVNDAPTIARICLRLDGIPLALELAAARVTMMTVAEIAQRLDDRFHLLTGGARTSLPRQQTLRASIDWSYNLLSADERTLLARLSVFAGGWTLRAMEIICAGDGPAAFEILDGATRLMDKSLVIAYRGEVETRYRMLETIRQYAGEKLLEAEGNVRDRHLEYYMHLATEAEPKLQGAEQLIWFKRLEEEKNNLRAAIDWSLRSDQIESGLCLAAALFSFWDNKGYWSEGYGRLSALLKDKTAGNGLVRAKALVAAGSLASACGYSTEMRSLFDEGIQMLRNQGEAGKHFLGLALAEYAKAFIDRDLKQGRALAEEGIKVSREANDSVGLAYGLWTLSMMARRVPDFETARAAQEESMELFQKLGNRSYYALLMSNLAYTFYFQSNLDPAREYFDLSMKIAREIGDRYSECNSIAGRGDIARRGGNYEESETLLKKSLAFHREIGSAHQGLVNDLNSLGLLELTRGNLTKAHEYLREGALAAGKGNLLHFLRFILDALAYLASADNPRRAAQFFGAAEMLRERLGTQLYPIEQEEYAKYLTMARTQLDEGSWNAAWNEGRSMTVERVVDLALSEE